MPVRVHVVTGTRAEYGILRPLLARLEDSETFEMGLIVTGTHLSERYGETVREVEADGYRIVARIPLDLDDDSEAGVTQAAAQALAGFGEAIADERPDAMLVLGDRIEILAAATAALLARVPVVHLHGGEVTLGAIDDAVRHSITKMGWLHLTATELARDRVVQMGEDPARVFATGALGVDNAVSLAKRSREELEAEFGPLFGRRTAVVTYHPVTLDAGTAEAQAEQLVEALRRVPDLNVVMTAPNSDAGNRAVYRVFQAFAAEKPESARLFTSLGSRNYMSLVEHADVVVGNSSSGVIEAPSLGTPSVDVGDRQEGRERGPSVLHAENDADSIASAIAEALSEPVRRIAAARENPYGDGHAADRIIAILERELTGTADLKKGFHDIARDGRGGGSAT